MKRFANEERQPPASPSPSLKIARRYQPQAAALDALVDVLYQLLADSTESPGSSLSTVLGHDLLLQRQRGTHVVGAEPA